MRVLVTGATGFLGGWVVRGLLARGDSVRAFGRDADALGRLAAAGAEGMRGDLRDAAAVARACAGMEAVIHAGALSAPWGPAAEFHSVNVAGTGHVVSACRESGVRRLVYVSSPSVVFTGRDHHNLGESAPYPSRFTSVYSLTKKLGEDAVRAADLPAFILRPKALFGPGDTALLPRLLAAARRGRLPQIGDGRNRVDLTYVENAAQAALLALDAPDSAAGTYTITNGEPALLWEVIRRVLAHAGLPTRLRRVPLPAALAAAALMEARAAVTGREPLLTRYTVAILARTQTYDITAARERLGYRPAVPLEEGIRRTLSSLEGGRDA
jgi:nucleoside-diphosphate-sugar epimerase